MLGACLVWDLPGRIVLGGNNEDGCQQMLFFFDPLANVAFEDGSMGDGEEGVVVLVVAGFSRLVLPSHVSSSALSGRTIALECLHSRSPAHRWKLEGIASGPPGQQRCRCCAQGCLFAWPGAKDRGLRPGQADRGRPRG